MRCSATCPISSRWRARQSLSPPAFTFSGASKRRAGRKRLLRFILEGGTRSTVPADGGRHLRLAVQPPIQAAKPKTSRSPREDPMKAFMIACLALMAAPAFAQQSAPEIAFDSVPDFPKLPQGMNFGEVPGVDVN